MNCTKGINKTSRHNANSKTHHVERLENVDGVQVYVKLQSSAYIRNDVRLHIILYRHFVRYTDYLGRAQARPKYRDSYTSMLSVHSWEIKTVFAHQ